MNFPATTTSYNNRLVVETYQKEGLRANTSSGFAHLSQKMVVKGLKVLIDAKLNDGSYVPAGSIAFIREEVLHTQQWATKVLESEGVTGQFLIVDMSQVEFIHFAEVKM